MAVRETAPDGRASRHDAIVQRTDASRDALVLGVMFMDVLAAVAVEAGTDPRGYFVAVAALVANFWVCCVGWSHVRVLVGDDGIASGRSYIPFSAIRSVVTPFRWPGRICIQLDDGRCFAYLPPPDGELIGLRTQLLQRLGAYRRVASTGTSAMNVAFETISSARGGQYRRPFAAAALWSVVESPMAPPSERARAALELSRALDASPSDRMRMHAAATATAHPDLRRLLLATAGHEELSVRAKRRLLRTFGLERPALTM